MSNGLKVLVLGGSVTVTSKNPLQRTKPVCPVLSSRLTFSEETARMFGTLRCPVAGLEAMGTN